MKNEKLSFDWVKEVESLVRNPKFCETISACQELLEEVNSLIPSSRMKFLKLNLSLAIDILKLCKKQTFRLVWRLRRHC